MLDFCRTIQTYSFFRVLSVSDLHLYPGIFVSFLVRLFQALQMVQVTHLVLVWNDRCSSSWNCFEKCRTHQVIGFQVVGIVAVVEGHGYCFNTLRPRQNGRRFTDIFKRIFLNENIIISIKTSLRFVPMVRINNTPALVQIMSWRRPGDKPLSEPMLVSLLTHICVTRPQWVYVIEIWNLLLVAWNYFIWLTELCLVFILAVFKHMTIENPLYS